MRSLSGVRWTVFCLLLWKKTAPSEGLRCSVEGQAEAQHPVQGLLERFEAGPGCAAREQGNKETHVIAVGRATSSSDRKVTVLLKPLSLTPSPLKALHLLLSSKLPVNWYLEADRLPPNLPVVVQISSNSTVQSNSLHLHVQTVHSLPFRPRALHRWALKHHGNLSSFTHTTHGNRVYIKLGEDPNLPALCQLQSMFLSHNYMTSDLQQQEVQGCSDALAGAISPEVHVIKLHSAGSGLCGSLQVEVVVSLVPPVINSRTKRVVLVLSSSVPVNWAIVSHGVRGHISVHSSNSISPPFPPEPDLTVSSSLNSDLSSIPDLLMWASENGYTKVTSYTEADLANRFVIQLAGGGTDEVEEVNPLVVKPSWAEERRLRQWLNGGDGARGGRESFTVQCEDGRLDVTVDQQILQSLSLPVAAVTLRDSTCQAQSNGSHFLLVFPVISCGTEGLNMGQPRGVQYKNMVLLWREKPQTIRTLNETEKMTKSPLGIHFSCLAAVPAPLPGPAESNEDGVNTPLVGLVPWIPKDLGPDMRPSHLPISRYRSWPVLVLRLFVSEGYEQGRDGPCVITADHRVFVEISAKGSFIDAVEVKSCVVSSSSDPKKSRFWTVISDSCSSDPSVILAPKTRDEEEEDEEEEGEGDGEREKESEETERVGKSDFHNRDRDILFKSKTDRGSEKMKRNPRMMAEETIHPLRFSFILRPVFNDSMQFLHCSLRLCLSDSLRGTSIKDIGKSGCQSGLHIPPLISRSPGAQSQCEIRNLSRPMVVTQPISSLVRKMPRPPAGQRTKRLSVSPSAIPDFQRSPVMQIGVLISVVFTAFIMGVILMGGLWCVYNKTGARPASLEGHNHFTNLTHEGPNMWSPSSVSNQSSSSV
ncbi:transforming growth factor beta receptor type 3-like [Xyrichtys novacula]|uniref:Transforming growth factor beta receptor type 3-like n=1 Tax=Xyrichtys novacula TaxID=13765 RepID=A0AAV1GSW6_XYRNO|nr:transforming growth factor beta receptor type 3-like [Xyrichtys novacula]